MRRKFVSSLALLLLLNGLVKPLWIFGIDVKVQNVVGAANYGLYAALFSFTFIFNILLDLGLSHYNNRDLSQSPEKLVRNLAYLGSLKMVLALLYLAVTLTVGYFLRYRGEAFSLLAILALNQFLASFIIFLRSNVAGLQLFRSDAILSVLDKLLMLLLCGAWLYPSWELFPPFTIQGFAWVQTGSYLLTALVAFTLVRRKARVLAPRFAFGPFAERLRHSMPYALLLLLMALYTKVDSVMVEQIAGALENGIYAQGFRLLEGANQLGYLFSILLLPMFSGMLARREPVAELVQLAYGLIITLLLAVALSGFFYAEPLMEWLYDAHTERSSGIFRYLILSTLAFGTTYIFGTLLTANGQLRILNRIALVGFVANIGLNALLIPRQGALGAAWATLLTQSVTALLQLGWVLHLHPTLRAPAFWRRLGLFALLGLSGSWMIHTYTTGWWQGLLLLNGYLLLVAVLSGLNPVKPVLILLQARLKAHK